MDIQLRNHGGMPKRGPHQLGQRRPPQEWVRTFIKEWRIYRGLTVEELAEKAGMSVGNLSAIENRRQGYSADSLGRLAVALKTTAGALLTVNPTGDAANFWQLWERATAADRETLTIMAERLIKKREH